MFFDTHSDILYNIVSKRLQGEREVIRRYHLNQLQKGKMIGGIWDYFTNPDKYLCEFDVAIHEIIKELNENSDLVAVIKTRDDFTDNKLNVLLGFESLLPIQNEEHLAQMYNMGFRHAMLTWNESNQYATGVKGDPDRGLTEKGRSIVAKMEQLGMILDVSHANEKTFFDLMEVTTKPIIASHSNVYGVYPHYRNLKEMQIKKIAEKGGIIGVTAVKYFTDAAEPTVSRFVDHIDSLRNSVGVHHIAIGFDFMDYMVDDGHNANLVECPNAAHTNVIIQELEARKYSTTDIEKITSLNILKFLKENL